MKFSGALSMSGGQAYGCLVPPLPAQRQQLGLARSVHGLPAGDPRRQGRAMFTDIVAKVGLRGVPSRHQDGLHAVQRIADFTEKFMQGANLAAMLGRDTGTRVEFARFGLFGVELDQLGLVMVQPDHGMKKGHVDIPKKKPKTGHRFRR
jgi:hypothetical protein